MTTDEHDSPAKDRPIVVTLKGKPRCVAVPGGGKLKISKLTWRGHVQIVIARCDSEAQRKS